MKMYLLSFGPDYQWTAKVSIYCVGRAFELTMVEAQQDWLNTRIGFTLVPDNNATHVRFYHANWQQRSDHFHISSYCWAMYLRLLKRYVEHGEIVPYEIRLEV